jgi:hypothetical protein
MLMRRYCTRYDFYDPPPIAPDKKEHIAQISIKMQTWTLVNATIKTGRNQPKKKEERLSQQENPRNPR